MRYSRAVGSFLIVTWQITAHLHIVVVIQRVLEQRLFGVQNAIAIRSQKLGHLRVDLQQFGQRVHARHAILGEFARLLDEASRDAKAQQLRQVGTRRLEKHHWRLERIPIAGGKTNFQIKPIRIVASVQQRFGRGFRRFDGMRESTAILELAFAQLELSALFLFHGTIHFGLGATIGALSFLQLVRTVHQQVVDLELEQPHRIGHLHLERPVVDRFERQELVLTHLGNFLRRVHQRRRRWCDRAFREILKVQQLQRLVDVVTERLQRLHTMGLVETVALEFQHCKHTPTIDLLIARRLKVRVIATALDDEVAALLPVARFEARSLVDVLRFAGQLKVLAVDVAQRLQHGRLSIFGQAQHLQLGLERFLGRQRLGGSTFIAEIGYELDKQQQRGEDELSKSIAHH